VYPAVVLTQLRESLGEQAVVVDPDVLAARSHDRSGAPAAGTPLAVVRPTSTEQVSLVMRTAHARGVPVVPQGALTGLAGGADAVEGAILLDLTAMNRIVRIDPIDLVAVAQPGVITADLATTVAEHGLFYAPDPASASESTLGGNVATNAGGMRCVKYGVTRDAVRSLEVVLADGDVVRTSPPTVKAVGGLDLTSLLVGSEGTLGVITEITVGLLPAPGPVRGITASFGSNQAALDAANEIMVGPHRPSTLEFMDGAVIAAIIAYDSSVGLPDDAKAWLLVLTDSLTGAAEDVAAYAEVARHHGAVRIDVADDPERVDDLLRARRLLNVAMHDLRGDGLNEDVAVPRGKLAELLVRLAELSERVGLPIGTAGHVGDGNLHPVVCFDPNDPGETRIAHQTHEAILRLANELGGTVTGEHGIGLEKLSAVDAELGPRLRGLQRGIKDVLDPAGILNPGKKL